MSRFSLQGSYRVQSRRDYAPSILEGEWYGAPGLIDNEAINSALRAHPMWQGREQVSLRPALVRRRSGKFASEPDILYKQELFIPRPDSSAMTSNIVDVLKSRQNWIDRTEHLRTLFPDQYQQVLHRLHGLEEIIANEYMLHEAGHFLAYDVYAKQRDGHFSARGDTAWPLIYAEELRADLNAFGFAWRLLPPESATQIFLYNLMLRFGVHREGMVHARQAPYGLVPYLLFHLLQEVGFIRIQRHRGYGSFQLASLDTGPLLAVMQACARHAEQELNIPELAAADPLERALATAHYVRQRLGHTACTLCYAAVMNQAARTGERQ